MLHKNLVGVFYVSNRSKEDYFFQKFYQHSKATKNQDFLSLEVRNFQWIPIIKKIYRN